jgi:hypothetical protein
MSLIKGLQRRPLIVVTTVLACVALAVAVWRAPEFPAKASSEAPSDESQKFQKQLRKGVGSEVRFASKPEQADEAVASAADFIYWRSGLKMSAETKKRLAKAEKDVLNGKSPHITASELTDNMTTAVVGRLATLTDQEIQAVTEASSDENGEIRSRADARWGVLTKKDLIRQAQAGREWSKRGDVGLQVGLRSVIEEEVNNRLNTLSMTLPEQFGNANSNGLTPTQAFVIAYSVAADDPLTNSRSDIAEILMQKRIENRQTREERKAQKAISGRPYGPHGLLHPSAPQLFLNKSSVDKLLNLSEGGKNR